MQVLCALGARDGAQLVTRALTYLSRENLELVLLFVIDEGPRHGLERLRGPRGRGPRLGPERQARIAAAEARSGDAVLAKAGAAAAQAGVAAMAELIRGQSERVIVERAQAVHAAQPTPGRSCSSRASASASSSSVVYRQVRVCFEPYVTSRCLQVCIAATRRPLPA